MQQERRERWSARYERHAAERYKPLAEEFAEFYHSSVAKAVDLLHRMAECDRESAAINSDAPDAEHRRLPKVELMAREMDQFTTSQPSIIDTLVLPQWGESGAWPPPQPSFAVSYAAMMAPAYDPRYSADWAKAQAARAEAMREQQRRQGEYYERLTKEQEARQNAEERARFGRQP